MLHARHDFLADIAALVEVDAIDAVEIGFVRKRVAVSEVDAALRHAGFDAARFVTRHVGVNASRGLARHIGAVAERVRARIAHQYAFRDGGGAIEISDDRGGIGTIFDRDLCAQFVEAEPFGKLACLVALAIDQERARTIRFDGDNDHIEQDLALWRKQRRIARFPRGNLRHIVGNDILQERLGVRSADAEHAAIREQNRVGSGTIGHRARGKPVSSRRNQLDPENSR